MSSRAPLSTVGNGESIPLGSIAVLPHADLSRAIIEGVARGKRIAAYFGMGNGAQEVRLFALLADDHAGMMEVGCADVETREFPSIAPQCAQAHLFEREIAEEHGLTAAGHPWPGAVRDPVSSAGKGGFFHVEGEEVHEVGVGPVHAGVIEPGHFRFQCHGEEVLHLEIALGFLRRGIERRLDGGPDKRSAHYAETIAGDSTIAHGCAYCMAIEALSGVRVPPRAQAVRGVALELERIANHVGDLGALAGDVGFLPTAAYCGRVRGEYLNMTAEVCGSRFGRDLVRPGGVLFDVEPDLARSMLHGLDRAEPDTASAVNLLWDSSSVMARFEDTGRVTRGAAEEIGLVGPAARACGIVRDVRHDFPAGIYRFAHLPVCTWSTGDVFARALVRWLEVQQSIRFVREQLESLPEGPTIASAGALAPSHLAVALVEGWRGEVCHVAITGREGRLARYKVIDPSFHNWFGLALAMRGQPISDFPLCNKSFNLSYSGFDL